MQKSACSSRVIPTSGDGASTGWIVAGKSSEARSLLALGTATRNFGAALVPAATTFKDPKTTTALIVNVIVGIMFSFLAAGWISAENSSGKGKGFRYRLDRLDPDSGLDLFPD
jgi:hypothetical protein